MISTKYNKYYRMDVQINSDGSKTDKWEYIGPYYEFEESAEEHKKRAFIYKLFLVGLILSMFINLWIYSNLSKVIYIILPFCLNLFAVYLFITAVTFYKKPGKLLKINEKEKSADKFKQSSLFGILFTFLSLLGVIIYLLRISTYLFINDYIFILFQVIMLTIFIANALFTRSLTTKEVENFLAKKYEKL